MSKRKEIQELIRERLSRGKPPTRQEMMETMLDWVTRYERARPFQLIIDHIYNQLRNVFPTISNTQKKEMGKALMDYVIMFRKQRMWEDAEGSSDTTTVSSGIKG